MKEKNLNKLIIVFLLSLAFTGCKPKQSVLLQNSVCQAPCWQHITPGVTTSGEALDILNGLSFLDSELVDNPIKIESYDSWSFAKGISETSGRIIYSNDIVTEIRFFVGRHVTLGDMVDYYGEPDLVSAILGSADTNWLSVSLVYPSKGVFVNHFDGYWRPTKDKKVQISRNMSVFEVYYFAPNLYEELVETDFFYNYNRQKVQASIQPWAGFVGMFYVDLDEK